MIQLSKNQSFITNCIYFGFFGLITLLFMGCATLKSKKALKQLIPKLEKGAYKNQFTGLLIVDTKTNDTIISTNADNYFIPASTTKIFTFYAAKKFLSEKIPTLKYVETKDTLFIEGTGDPSWLHTNLINNTAIDFLSNTNKTIALNLNNYIDPVYRPGWAWEDYQYYFSPELSAMPIYGNVITLTDTTIVPAIAKKLMHFSENEQPNYLRHRFKNEFYIQRINNNTLKIPFITSKNLTKQFLNSILKRKIYLLSLIHI